MRRQGKLNARNIFLNILLKQIAQTKKSVIHLLAVDRCILAVTFQRLHTDCSDRNPFCFVFLRNVPCYQQKLIRVKNKDQHDENKIRKY